jgi:hypothetical protein
MNLNQVVLLLHLLFSTSSIILAEYEQINDPNHDHTTSAIEFDADGERDEDAEQAFRAAVRFNPNSIAKSLNLAVALHRYGKLEQSRMAFEDTFTLANKQSRPRKIFKRIARDFNALKKVWEEVYNEKMDPITSSNDSNDFELTMSQRLLNIPLYMLSEKKYLDQDTKERGKLGLESRIDTDVQAPPKMVVLTNINGMDTVLNYVGGKEFQTKYWEQWPLHIRAKGAMNNLVSLEYLLNDGPYGYGSEKTIAPHRNVNYLKRRFGNKDSIAKDTPQNKNNLLDAMRRNYTLQMLGTHYWIPSIANMSYWLSQATSRPVSVNLYSTPQNQKVSLVPHSDFQCALMVQIEGRKRWRLWKLPDIWLPVRYRHIRGRDDGDIVETEWLGKPYMDVVLEPGDILYVPRGCLHLTSTVEDDGKNKRKETKIEKRNKLLTPSVHLTVGMEAMWDHGVSATWEAFFGAGEFFRHDHVVESYYRALGNLIDKDIRFRETLPIDFLKVKEETESSAILGEGATSEFVSSVRERMHTMVDEMIDSTPFIKRIRRLMLLTKSIHNNQLKSVVESATRNGKRKMGTHTAHNAEEL